MKKLIGMTLAILLGISSMALAGTFFPTENSEANNNAFANSVTSLSTASGTVCNCQTKEEGDANHNIHEKEHLAEASATFNKYGPSEGTAPTQNQKVESAQ